MQVAPFFRIVIATLMLTPAAAAPVAPHGPRIDAVMKDWARSDGPGCAVGVIQAMVAFGWLGPLMVADRFGASPR